MSPARRLPVRTCAALAAFALAACSGGGRHTTSAAPTTSAGPSVDIGFIGPLTGTGSHLGQAIGNGVRLAVDRHNAKAGVHVKLITYDTGGDPVQAARLARAAAADHVAGVVGPTGLQDSMAADPVFEQAAVVNITPSATTPSLADNGWHYWHRVVGTDADQGPAVARYLVKKLNARKVAVVDEDTEYGKGIADIVRSDLRAGSVTVDPSRSIDLGQDDSAVAAAISAGRVDAVFYGGTDTGAGRLLKRLRRDGVRAAFVSDDLARDDLFIATAGATAAEGALLTCPCGDVSASPGGAAFISAYRAAFGTGPGPYSAQAYDAANLIMSAVDAGRRSAADVNTFISTTTYHGITNDISFDGKGQLTGGGIYLYRVRGGGIAVVGLVTRLLGNP